VSTTRQGGTPYSDNPPVPAGAKYPLMSMTTSVAPLANTSIERRGAEYLGERGTVARKTGTWFVDQQKSFGDVVGGEGSRRGQ
jgi:hypothetical protein